LQEADVQWISSQECDINGSYYEKGYKEDEEASDEQDDQVFKESHNKVCVLVSLLTGIILS